mmetsp:Transcript_34545/g.86782  ORF Transcript_34545/g.86782 Transcript_34545/m.86782 type:complete len:760 (-) Transcript_34545:208-2487(-)
MTRAPQLDSLTHRRHSADSGHSTDYRRTHLHTSHGSTPIRIMSATTSSPTEGAIRQCLLDCLPRGLPLDPLPENTDRDSADSEVVTVPHAPTRVPSLSPEEAHLAVCNALRYFPPELHTLLAPEFMSELERYGHIYMYRFRPTEYEMKAYPIDYYPTKCRQAAAIIHMIHNNLDGRVAQFPHELVTYGGNGSVFSNWAQYHLVMEYLCSMTEEQTLILCSGHPHGLVPSHPDAPRCVITNGMMVPNYSTKELYEKFYALGTTLYGQMTAGSFAYIGPQGIVHGTAITLLNAGRKYLGSADLSGKVYVSSGLGGMSGAQPKAGTIDGCIAVIAEMDRRALEKRHAQGWVQEVVHTTDECLERIRQAKKEKRSTSIAYLGNVVTLWEALCEAPDEELLVDLGSDQTSLHNPFNGGYYPVQLSFEEANVMMKENTVKFKSLVEESLRRQVRAINQLAERGLKFWDYGNSFLLEASRAGADVFDEASGSQISSGGGGGQPPKDQKVHIIESGFRYPSYVEDIMGDIFSMGFGPFRWVCTSGLEADLLITDRLAGEVIDRLGKQAASAADRMQYEDNALWIRKAHENRLVVGSQARILYSNAQGRIEIALAFNEAVASGELQAPVVLSRDHHDVSGTDSPFRETSNIRDGSKYTADMAVQNFVGDGFRGATWISLHNGGGTGWGEAMNGGFGLVMDGSEAAARRARLMLHWDVNNGVCRRAWAGNPHADRTIREAMRTEPRLRVSLASPVDSELVRATLQAAKH